MLAAIVEHARRALPNEACGIVAGDRPWAEGGRPLRWIPLANTHVSPFRYAIDPDALLALTIELDDRGEAIWAIVHSHPTSPAEPSPTDVREAFYPEALQLIVSLMNATAGVRAWRVEGRLATELSLARPA
ncbi:MAG TPA: M67 family metallopeptidase [Candidatus Limnocylindrales bacterium]|nr:M67 family metallopeptidase [Candidatus Limnocylindrales bacterium]